MISRYGWRGALVAIALAGCGGDESARGDEAPAPPAEGERGRVVFLGTSLTAGLGLDPEQAYPAVIQTLADSNGLRVQVVNAGLSGETSAGALRRVEWLLRDGAPEVVVVESGANDGLRGLLPDSTQANLVGKAQFMMWSTDGSVEWIKPWTWFSAARWERIGGAI